MKLIILRKFVRLKYLTKESLQHEEPWKLTHIEYDDKEEAWHLFIDFEKGSTFACPNCRAASKAHDTEKKHWRHLDFWDWKTYMHARVPRTGSGACNKVTLVPVPWSRPTTHFTSQFDAWAMRLMAEMPVSAAAHELREHDTRMWRIFHHYVDKAMSDMGIVTPSDSLPSSPLEDLIDTPQQAAGSFHFILLSLLAQFLPQNDFEGKRKAKS